MARVKPFQAVVVGLGSEGQPVNPRVGATPRREDTDSLSVENLDTTTVPPEVETGTLTRSPERAPVAIAGFFRRDALAVVILAAGFVARWLLADVNSYWLDELYSVAIYGVWNDSALEAVRNLANTSIHPPLYQFVLYNWMEWLGDSEAATRTLSNTYVTFAGLFLYLLTRNAFSRAIAVSTTAIFSLMYTTMFFGLETRSYAQTIFLATVSSYLLLRILHIGGQRGWRSALIAPGGAALVLANTALLLTHYYNIFFVIAQALCVVAFVLLQFRRRRLIAGLGTVAIMYGLPGALFLGIWGRVFVATYTLRAGEFAVGGTADLIGPIDVLHDSVIGPNLRAPDVILIVGAILAIALLVRTAIRIAGPKQLDAERRGAYANMYLTAWLVLPVGVAYVAFFLLGVAQYSDRYFLFSTIPLAPIVVLALAEAWRLGRSVSKRLRLVSLAGLVGVTSVVVIATMIAPGTYSAAASDKADWRGTAQSIVGVVESDPDLSYILYETSFRTTPVLDYHLARYSESLRVDGTLRRAEERRGYDYEFERNEDIIRQSDFLIVAFTHHSTAHFPIAIETLEDRYADHHRHLDASGRGYIVFRTSPEQGQ